MRRRLATGMLVGATVFAFGIPVATAARETPSEWAEGMCVSLSDWLADVDERLVSAAAETPSNPAAARNALTRTLAQLARRTNKLVGAIEAGGAPDVAGGKAIVRGLADVYGDVVAGMRDVRTQIVDAPDDPGAVAATIREAVAELQNLLVQTNLDVADLDLGSRALRRAVTKVAACQELFAD